ncbi:MAG: hypothetical protein U9R17_17475 [Thermodesulfobacteriota bacterium]|nr:hypothetical protein [Thermodesulfobacteriota bacterium]
MTIKLPQPNILDRFLHFIGKKRGIIIPTKAYRNYGQYVYATGKKESFWKALFRRKDVDLPNNMADVFEYYEKQKNSR